MAVRQRVFLTLLTVLIASPVFATDLSTQKLFGRWDRSPVSYYLGFGGSNAALSPKWIVVGAPEALERDSIPEGAVQVFNAATGAWVRKLLPPGTPTPSQAFGGAVAICGDLVVIGARFTDGSRGRAYLYDLPTGKLLRTLLASDSAPSDLFGYSVATNGTFAVVSAPEANGKAGAVYLFDVASGEQTLKMPAPDPGGSQFFGEGLAVEGNVLAAGARGYAAGRGAIYFYDLTTQALIKRFQPATSGSGDQVGFTLAMSGGRVIIGCKNSGKAFLHDLGRAGTDVRLSPGAAGLSFGWSVAIDGPMIAVSEYQGGVGKVHLFQASDGTFLKTIPPPNNDPSSQSFGYNVALQGNTLLATAPNDSVQALNAGAIHLIKPVTVAMPYTKVVAQGDSAPGAADISYGTIAEAFANDGNTTVLFTAKLTGEGSNRNRDTAAFADLVTTNNQQLLYKSRQEFIPGVAYGAISRITSNDDDLAIGYATLTGTGINPTNNALWWYKTNVSTGTLLRTGDPVVEFGGAILASAPEAVTSLYYTAHRCAAYCTLRTGDPTTDSGVWAGVAGLVGGSFEGIQEGDPIPSNIINDCKLGQFAPRICFNTSKYVYSTALVGSFSATNNAAPWEVRQAWSPAKGISPWIGLALASPTRTIPRSSAKAPTWPTPWSTVLR